MINRRRCRDTIRRPMTALVGEYNRATAQKKRQYLYPRAAEPDAPIGRFESFVYAHRFQFLQDASSFSFAVKILAFEFSMGHQADFFWTGVNFQDDRTPSPTNEDALQSILVSFFTKGGQQEHQSEAVPASLYRGDGFDATAERSYALPYKFPEPTLVSKGDSIRVELENTRATTGLVDVSLFGWRWYDL